MPVARAALLIATLLAVTAAAPAALAQDFTLAAPLTRPLAGSLARPWLAQNASLGPHPQRPAGTLPVTLCAPGSDCQRIADADRLRLGRWVVSPLVGWASGTLLGLLAGIGASAVMCKSTDTYETCVGSVVLGAYAGFLVGAPLGITISAGWFRGLGSYTGALLGTLFGVAIAIPVALIARSEFVTYSIGAIPAFGGLLVYEIQGAVRRRAMTAPALTVSPSISPVGADGRVSGLALGLTVRGL